MGLPPKVYTWLCGLFASLGSIIFGYDLGVIAGVLPAPDFKNVMGPRYADPNLQGLITSIFVLGWCCATLFSLVTSAQTTFQFLWNVHRRIERNRLCCSVGGVLQTAAQNMDMMLAGRFFAGYGVGIVSDLAPLYQAEIAHPSIRGRLTTLQQFMLGIGAFCASWITYGTSAGLKGTPAEWRVPLGIQIIPAIPLICFMLLLPESPRWLMEKGREDEARATLARLHARGDINDKLVIAQIEDMKADISKTKDIGEATWAELFTVPSNFRRLSLGYILQFSVQMTGVSAIQYYSTTIFTTMGFTSTRILLFQSINSVIALIGEACCVLWIDHTGRRRPLIIGNIASGLSFVVGSILMARWPGTVNNNAAHYIFIITTWVFNFFFSACIGPLSWAYPAEIFSTRTRAKSTAITSSSSWISNFFIAQVTPRAFLGIGWKYYLVFAICGHTNAFVIWAFYPVGYKHSIESSGILTTPKETTGRRLEEMDALFEDAPLFVPNTEYAEMKDRHSAERELREGTFVPGGLTGGPVRNDIEGGIDEKASSN
ncbi:hypothetical protein D9756_010563 [Leucocoprinus leucothites]|uniref:Major facilitator superfamily (MFS) profile domain-containing protein n=1 Tax=Leucocoprinus leucothites TaxID=201217 RepID=A0A8H5FS77_9AGAR|nr:hypothetical protein D9756_010563 [Leucoagaricus leucothites]